MVGSSTIKLEYIKPQNEEEKKEIKEKNDIKETNKEKENIDEKNNVNIKEVSDEKTKNEIK